MAIDKQRNAVDNHKQHDCYAYARGKSEGPNLKLTEFRNGPDRGKILIVNLFHYLGRPGFNVNTDNNTADNRDNRFHDDNCSPYMRVDAGGEVTDTIHDCISPTVLAFKQSSLGVLHILDFSKDARRSIL